MDIEFEVTDPALIEAYTYLCEHVPEFVNTVTEQVASETGPELLKDFQQEPPPVKTPIHWTSDAQRRYVMMMKRKGLIPSPYVRTHAITLGFQMAITYAPGEMSSIELWNAVPEATYVIGLRQQRWHAETGWYYAPDKAAYWLGVLLDRMETALIRSFYAIDGYPTGARYD